MNVITQKANNVQTTAGTLAETLHLNGMKSDGSPVKLPMTELTISKADMTEAMATQIQSVYNQMPEMQSFSERMAKLLGLYTDRASLTLSTSATGAQQGNAIVPAVSGSMYG